MDNLDNVNHYKMALKKVRELMKLRPQKGSAAGDEMDRLVTLIEAYESIHVPMQAGIFDPDGVRYL